MICLCVNKYFKMPEYSHLQVLANPMNIVIPINLSFTLFNLLSFLRESRMFELTILLSLSDSIRHF